MNTLQKWQASLGAQPDASFPHIAHFGDVDSEYRAAKNACALIDVTGLGVLTIAGTDCADLLHRLTMNEIRKMQPGDVVVNALPNAKGKLVDAFFQLKENDGFRLITGFGRSAAVAAWLDRYIFIEDVRCEDLTARYALFLLVGDKTANALGTAVQTGHSTLAVNGKTVTCLPATGLSPAGVLLLVEQPDAFVVYKALIEEKKCTPAGAQVYHTLRVEQSVPIFGNEFANEDTNPYEAGLKNHIDYDKGCYIGQEVIARLDTYDKVRYEFCQLAIDGPATAVTPVPIMDGDKEVGVLTSSVPDPKNKTGALGLGLGRIRRKTLQQKNRFTVVSGEKAFDLTVLSSTL